MATDLKSLIKKSSNKSSKINENNYQNTLAAQIAKADLILGVVDDIQKPQQKINKKLEIDLVERFLITLPKKELEKLVDIVDKYLSLGRHVTKSEIVRLGILLVSQLSDEAKIVNMNLIPKLKSGRKKLG